jgi:hypothetical protein
MAPAALVSVIPGDLDTQLIIAAVLAWSETVIEQPHPVFGGLPICPFARAARLRDTAGDSCRHECHEICVPSLRRVTQSRRAAIPDGQDSYCSFSRCVGRQSASSCGAQSERWHRPDRPDRLTLPNTDRTRRASFAHDSRLSHTPSPRRSARACGPRSPAWRPGA